MSLVALLQFNKEFKTSNVLKISSIHLMLTISKANYEKQKEKHLQEFPGGPVVRTQGFHCRSLGSIPGQGTKIPASHKVQTEKKKKKKKIEKHLLLISNSW